MDDADVLDDLWDVISSRAKELPTDAYTTKLILDKEMLYGKIREESEEVIVAAQKNLVAGKDSLSWELADLIYHLLVLSAACGLDFNEVFTELKNRRK